MTATVQRDDVKSRVGEDLAGVLPGEPVLPAAVQHQDGRLVGGVGDVPVPLVADQREVVDTAERDGRRCGIHGAHGHPLGRPRPHVTHATTRFRGGPRGPGLRPPDTSQVAARTLYPTGGRYADRIRPTASPRSNTWLTTKLPPTARGATLTSDASAQAVTQVAEVEDDETTDADADAETDASRTTTPRTSTRTTRRQAADVPR